MILSNSLYESVDIIVPAFNSEKLISQCLNSIKNLRTPGLQTTVIVVDNNSTDKTVEISRSEGFEPFFCRKQGRSHARNWGAKHGSSKYIAFVDSDVILSPDWLIKMRECLNSPCVGLAQGAIIPSGTKFLDKYRYQVMDSYTNGHFVEIESGSNKPFVDSAAFLIRRNVFESIMGFNEGLRSNEDFDLSIRCIRNGHSIQTNSKAKAFKLESRDMFSFLVRSFQYTYDFFKYMKFSNKGDIPIKQLFLPPVKLAKPSFFICIYHWINYIFLQLGIIAAYLKKDTLTSTPPWLSAKLNLLLPTLKFKDDIFVLSPTMRFTLGSGVLIFHGPTLSGGLRFNDPAFVNFFYHFLNYPKASLTIPYEFEYLIQEILRYDVFVSSK